MRKSTRRGSGSIYHQAYKKHGVTLHAKTWMIAYPDGKGGTTRESAKTTVWAEANKLLNKRIGGELREEEPASGPAPVTVETLITLIEKDCANHNRNPKTYRDSRFPRMREFMADVDMREGPSGPGEKHVRWDNWHTRVMDAMKAKRTPKGTVPQNATLNRIFEAWHKGMVLAQRAGLVDYIPTLEDWAESAPRSGFLEEVTLEKILAHVRQWWHNMYRIDLILGERSDSELTKIKKSQVMDGYLRLEPGTTKNKAARMFPLTGQLKKLVEAQLAQVAELEKRIGRDIEWLFPRDVTGLALFSAYKPWKAGAIAAGFPNSMPHDFRRSSAMRLSNDKVPQATAMRLLGLKTPSMHRRYNIPDPDEFEMARKLMEGGDKKRKAAKKKSAA